MKIRKIIGAVLLFTGIVGINFPVASTLQGNATMVAKSEAVVADHPVSTDAIKSAEEYNRNLVQTPVLDPWLNEIRGTENEFYTEYNSLLKLDDSGIMGRVLIPAINVALPVFHDSTDAVLTKGAGHLFGSHLPVGATAELKSNTAIITAHSGLMNATMFDNLPKLKKGDLIYMDYGNNVRRAWRMTRSWVIEPYDVSSLNVDAGVDRLLLITCTPYGVNTHRLIVEAVRDKNAEAQAKTVAPTIDRVLPSWVYGVLAADAIILLLLILLFIRKRRSAKKTETREQVKQRAVFDALQWPTLKQ